MKTLTIKTVNGLEIKLKVVEDVAKFIKQVAIVEIADGQKTYKINNIIYIFDDEN